MRKRSRKEVRPLAEGYVRYQSGFHATSRVGVVIEGELQRIMRSTWGLVAVLGAFIPGLIYIGNLFEVAQAADVHSMDTFLTMTGGLLWGSLAVAVVTGTTSLLVDKQHGSLELYLTRSITPGEYLAGKSLTQFILTGGVVFVPIVVYFLLSYVLSFNEHPEGWAKVIPVGLFVAAGWGFMMAGLALGVSALGRSTAGAIVFLAGAFVLLEMVLQQLAGALTQSPYVALMSPIQVGRQLIAWAFGAPLPHDFDVIWAGAVWLVLVVLGWGLLLWRRPRVKGLEEVSG